MVIFKRNSDPDEKLRVLFPLYPNQHSIIHKSRRLDFWKEEYIENESEESN
jgi:hypothetical protein